MFENISEKLKQLANIICWLGIICSVIAGLCLMEETPVLGWIVLVFGSIFSWVSSLLMYGFGELIDKATEIAQNTRNSVEKA